MGLRAGCLPLAGVHFCQQLRQLCDREEVEDQIHLLIICPAFKDLRLQLFNHVHCNTLTGTFFEQLLANKSQFNISYYDNLIVNMLSKTTTSIQSLVHCHHTPFFLFSFIVLFLLATSKPMLAVQPLIPCSCHFILYIQCSYNRQYCVNSHTVMCCVVQQQYTLVDTSRKEIAIYIPTRGGVTDIFPVARWQQIDY